MFIYWYLTCCVSPSSLLVISVSLKQSSAVVAVDASRISKATDILEAYNETCEPLVYKNTRMTFYRFIVSTSKPSHHPRADLDRCSIFVVILEQRAPRAFVGDPP